MSTPCRVASLAGCLRRALNSALTAALGVHMRKRRTSTTSNLSRSSRGTAQAILDQNFQDNRYHGSVLSSSTQLRSFFSFLRDLSDLSDLNIGEEQLMVSGASRDQRAHPPRWRAWILRVGASPLVFHGEPHGGFHKRCTPKWMVHYGEYH